MLLGVISSVSAKLGTVVLEFAGHDRYRVDLRWDPVLLNQFVTSFAMPLGMVGLAGVKVIGLFTCDVRYVTQIRRAPEIVAPVRSSRRIAALIAQITNTGTIPTQDYLLT